MPIPPPRDHGVRARLSGWLHRRPQGRLGLTLAGDRSAGSACSTSARSLFLFVECVLHPRRLHRSTSSTRRPWSNFRACSDPYPAVTFRTVSTAAAVTVSCAVLAFPIAYYMARVASPRRRSLLVVAGPDAAVASYLIKIYSWRLMLANEGVLNWLLEPFGLRGPGQGDIAVWLVVHVSVAAVHDPARLRRPRADPQSLAGSLVRPRWAPWHDVPEGGAAADLPGGRRGIDLHVQPDPRRLHRAATRLDATRFIGNLDLRQRRRRRESAPGGRLRPRALAIVVIYLIVARKLGAFEAL